MPLYGIGITPMMSSIVQINGRERVDIKHVAFADDLSGAGKIEQLKMWWDLIIKTGRFIGYEVNPGKSWLIVKEVHLQEAMKTFENTGINITKEGKRQLGAVVGSEKYKDEHVSSLVNEWIGQLQRLSRIAKTYAAFTHGFRHKFTYVMRTIPNISKNLYPLDEAVNSFISKIFGDYKFSVVERQIYSLPVKMGGFRNTDIFRNF